MCIQSGQEVCVRLPALSDCSLPHSTVFCLIKQLSQNDFSLLASIITLPPCITDSDKHLWKEHWERKIKLVESFNIPDKNGCQGKMVTWKTPHKTQNTRLSQIRLSSTTLLLPGLLPIHVTGNSF